MIQQSVVAKGWGQVSRTICLWRSRRGVGSPNGRRLHPTRIRTLAAQSPKRLAACRGNAIPGRSRYLFVPALPAIQGGWLIPEGMSRLWRLGMRGRRRGLVPGGERGGGRVSVTGNCHSSSSRRLCRAYSWAGRKTRARFTLPRPLPPPVVISRSHIALLLRGSSVFVVRLQKYGTDRRPLQATGCPRHHPPTHISDSQ